VKELRPALRLRVPPERAAEMEGRFRQVGVAREIDEGGADVFAVAVVLVGNAGGLEAPEKLVVVEQIASPVRLLHGQVSSLGLAATTQSAAA
jgi:hypothetical protein